MMPTKTFEPKKYDTEGKLDTEIVDMLPKIYKLLEEVIDTYMDLTDKTRKILCAWIITAPLYRNFYAFPYLFVNASKSSGKTRLLSLIKSLVPDSIMVSGLSQSALFRSRVNKDLILIDEAERLHGKEKENLLDLLNSGYKRGGVVLRVEGIKEKKVVEYDTYGPIVLANVWGLDSILESKCIRITLSKTQDQRIIHTPEMFELDERIKIINKYLDAERVYVGSVLDTLLIKPMYNYIKYIYIYNTSTYNTHTNTNSLVKDFLSQVQAISVDGRTFELFLPLLMVAYTISTKNPDLHPSIFMELLDILKQDYLDRMNDEIDTDRDSQIALELYEYLVTLDSAEYLILNNFIAWLGTDAYDWIKPSWIAKFLKRADIKQSQKRTGHGNEYMISKARLKKYLSARNLLNDADSYQDGGYVGRYTPQIKIKNIDNNISDSILNLLKKSTKGVILGSKSNRWVVLYNYLSNSLKGDIDNKMKTLIQSGDIVESKPGCFRIVHLSENE